MKNQFVRLQTSVTFLPTILFTLNSLRLSDTSQFSGLFSMRIFQGLFSMRIFSCFSLCVFFQVCSLCVFVKHQSISSSFFP